MKIRVNRDDLWLGLLSILIVALLTALVWQAMLTASRYMRTLASDPPPQHERP